MHFNTVFYESGARGSNPVVSILQVVTVNHRVIAARILANKRGNFLRTCVDISVTKLFRQPLYFSCCFFAAILTQFRRKKH